MRRSTRLRMGARGRLERLRPSAQAIPMNPARPWHARRCPMRIGTLAVLAACTCAGAHSAGPALFEGRVVLEVLDEVDLDHKLRLREAFAFRDEHGRLWPVPKGAVIDGTSLPRALG